MADNYGNGPGSARFVAANVCATLGHTLALFTIKSALVPQSNVVFPTETELRCIRCTLTAKDIQQLRTAKAEPSKKSAPGKAAEQEGE